MARATAEQRLARLLAIIPWVVENGGATVTEIASRFGIAEREVLAELTLVQCCEIPPYGPDHTLGIAVVDDEVLVEPAAMLRRPLRLGPSEGFGLLTAGRAALAVPGADSHGALASAVDKLEEALGDRAPVVMDIEQPALLDELRVAVRDALVLTIDYYTASRDELTHREIEPLGLVHTDGHWYLRAHCRRADDLRTFRVDRIDAAVPTGGTHSRTASADDHTFALADEDLLPTVRIAIPERSRWVVEAHPTMSVEELGDELVVELPVSGPVFLERLLLRLGAAARVVEADDPDVGRAAAARLLALYEAD
jgi:proteasome accessory factor C